MLEESRTSLNRAERSLWLSAAALALIACAAAPAPKEPVLQTAPDAAASAAASAAAPDEGEGGAEATGAADQEPKAEEKKEPAAEKPPVRRSGRPAAVFGPSKKIASTFGTTPGSVLKLKVKGGSFTLKLPEFALPGPTNITFETVRTLRGASRVVGSPVHLLTSRPKSTRLSRVAAADRPFEVYVPLNGKDSVNLAVGEVALDEDGQEKAKVSGWKVYAPKRVDSGLNQAYFELKELGPASYLYATTREATEASQ